MDKNFDFKRCEAEINKKWLAGDYFSARVNPDKKPYTIIMPPPNITSRLHIGHAYTFSIQDILIRFKRMQGYEALLLPGADHAAIATEVKVVEELKKQGIEKSSLTREQFLEHIEAWYTTYTAQIVEQLKRLGISCDWSRFAFTMDATTTKAVKEVFKRLQDSGHIYQGERMINWCTSCRSALCDAEVVFEAQSRMIYEIKYGDLVVATTRPETMFGDVAVAVNPKDKRYAKYIGRSVPLPLTNRMIPVIADDYVDIKFGTGVLKITPAHDPADNAIGAKHNLESITVIDECGLMMKCEHVPNGYEGLTREKCRAKAVAELKAMGLLVSQKNYSGNIGRCYRCADAIEPRVSKQWFVAMKDLAKPCIDALDNGLVIVPKKYKKTYLHWLHNIKDWCISRQLLSGHRVPVDGEVDVLDTWFSSALWPFCTLGWPEKSADFDYFYPTQTMVTAYDIIFFWVIRMVFSGIEHTGKLPFDTVLFHGLVRDIKGRKMSKSLGNGIDPVDVIEKFGVDALRFSLLAGTKMDRDPRYSVEKAELARNFINKIWNAVKFYKQMAQGTGELSEHDKWILTKLNNTVKSVTKKYEKFDFGIVAAELQTFFWNDVCDWYIEVSKSAPNKEVFGTVIKTFLGLMSPIMPFVTEQIYVHELGLGDSLMLSQFPAENRAWNFPREAKEFEAKIAEIKRQRAEEADRAQLGKKIELLKKEIARGEAMLGNKGFVAKAPKQVVELEKQKLVENKKLLAQIDKM
jgi:valyl-tRNA synthetase